MQMHRTSPALREPNGGRAHVSARPRLATAADYLQRVYDGLANDNAFFLAGGVAFSLLLALVPSLLLVVVGLSFLLGRQPTEALGTLTTLTETFLPRDTFEVGALLRTTVGDVLRTRGAVGVGAALGFVWTSTRLFGSLRAVLSIVFARDERGIVAGKLFDVVASVATTLVVALWALLSTYLSVARARGVVVLTDLGVRVDALGTLSYLLGRAVGLVILVSTFYAVYRLLPRRRPSAASALVGAVAAAVLFEIARQLYVLVLAVASPGSLYTGTIAVIVSVVFWVYYGALLFVVGAQFAQAHEARRREAGSRADTAEVSPSPAAPDPS